MLGTYFYHEIIRKNIISFGTLFNNIYIKHLDKSGAVTNQQKLVCRMDLCKKFLAKIQQQEDLTKPVAISLPRMSFEMTNIQYDSSRKNMLHRLLRQQMEQMRERFLCLFHTILDLN